MNLQTQQFFTLEFINLQSLHENLERERELQSHEKKINRRQISIKKPSKKINKIQKSGPKPTKNRQPPQKIQDDMEDDFVDNQNNLTSDEMSEKIIRSIFDQEQESVNDQYIKLPLVNKQNVPLRVIKGEVYRTEFHQKFSFDVLQILIFQSYQNLSWEYKNYVKQKIVEQNLFAIFVTSNEDLHDTSLKGYPVEYQVAKYMDELVPLQKTTNFYFNPNQAKKQKNIREHIIKQVENIIFKRAQTIKNWLQENSNNKIQEPYLDEWAQKDLIQNMSYFPNLLKQLNNFQAKLYYQIDDKFLNNLQPQIKRYQQEQQKELEIIYAKKLKKVEKILEIEKIPDIKKIIDIQIVRQLALRQLIQYDPLLKNYIKLFLGRPRQQEIVDEYYKKVQSIMMEISIQYDETKQNVKLKRTNIKKFEDLYEISMPDKLREPDIKIEDAVDPKYLDDSFARFLAHKHTISPIEQLEQYVNLIYGRPRQKILVQEFLNRVKFHQQKMMDQIEMQTRIIISSRLQSKYNKQQQYSQLQNNLSVVYTQQELDQQISWDKNIIDDIARQYFTNHLIKAQEEFFNFKRDKEIIQQLNDAQIKNQVTNKNTKKLYYEYLKKIDPQKIFDEQAMGRTSLGNLKILLGYPDTQILNLYQTLITGAIKSQLEKYINHLQNYQEQQKVLNLVNKKQQQLFFNRNELIYCEFGKGVFGKGFKILNIKLLKSNQDIWSKQITDDILKFTQWKQFVGKQFKRFKLFKHTYFNTFFENVNFEYINHGYEMQNDTNDIFIFIVNVSQKDSFQNFKNFFQKSFKQRDFISFLLVILYEDVSQESQKNIQFLLEEANKFRLENVIIQKNQDKKITNSTHIITEKVGEIIQTRIKQEDQTKLIFIDLFYDYNEFSKKIQDQYGSHIDIKIIEDNFYNYFNKKCPFNVSFNREFFKEIFADYLKNEIAFFQMTQDDLIIQIMRQQYKINRQLKHIRNFEFYVNEFIFDIEPQIEQNDCYQILIKNGNKIYKTKFQNIEKNKIIFKESLHFEMKDGDELQFKLNSYYHQKIVSMSQQNADQFFILGQEQSKNYFQMIGSQFYKSNGNLEVSIKIIPDQYDDLITENLHINSKDQEDKPIQRDQGNEANGPEIKQNIDLNQDQNNQANNQNNKINQISPIINDANNENYQTIFNKKQKNDDQSVQQIKQDQESIKLKLITKLLNQKQELNKLIMSEKEAQNIKNMYNIKIQMASKNQTMNQNDQNLDKEVNDKQIELEGKKEELKQLQDSLNSYAQKCQMDVIQYIVSVIINQKPEIIQNKFKSDKEFDDYIGKLLVPRVNVLNQLINCKQILLYQQQNVRNGFQQYIDFIKLVKQEYVNLKQIKAMKIDIPEKLANIPKNLRQKELQEICDKISQEIDRKTERKFEQTLDDLELYVYNLKQAQETTTQNKKNDENKIRQALINQKKILNEDAEKLQKQLEVIKKEKVQIGEKIEFIERIQKENQEKLNKLVKIKEDDDKKEKGTKQFTKNSDKIKATDKVVDDVDDKGDKNDEKVTIEIKIQKLNEKLLTSTDQIKDLQEKLDILIQNNMEKQIQVQLEQKKKEIQDKAIEFQNFEKKNIQDNTQNQIFEDLKKKFDEVEKNYQLIMCRTSYIKKKIFWIDLKSYQNQIQQVRDEIKQDKMSEEQLLQEFRKIPECSKFISIEQYFKEIREECSNIILKYNDVSNEQKKQKFTEDQVAKINAQILYIQSIEKKLQELKQKQSQIQSSSVEAQKANERNSIVQSLLDKKLTQLQKQSIQDYYIELTRTLTLHFNKALSIINDLFQVKQSSVDSALQQIGDIVPIPFFKTAFEIIRQLNSLYEAYKDAKEGHQLKKFSALFPTSTVLDTVFSKVANELSRDRKELLIQTQPIEKNKLQKIMKRLQEKFVEEDFYEEVDHGAKQMAHIDAALLISVCMQNFSDMYRPKEIKADDIYNIEGKVKILVFKVNEASKNNTKLFEDVQTINSKKTDDLTIDQSTTEKTKTNSNDRKAGCKTCSIQ